MLSMKLYKTVRKIYNNTIRRSLPKKNRTLAGVTVHDTPLFDLSADNPRYKTGFLMAIHDNISEGDTVDIIGFGRGVSTVHILRAGAKKVNAYEAASDMITLGTDTLKRNVDSNTAKVEIKNAVVGEPVDVYGDYSDADFVSPGELSMSDVFVLDCEGAETDILSNLGTYPNTIICETHPTKGAPPEAIVDILEDEYETSIREHKLSEHPTKVVVGHRKA